MDTMDASSPGRPLRPTVTPRVRRAETGETQLYVMNSRWNRRAPDRHELDVRGAPAWSPDGQWLAIAAPIGMASRICSRSRSAVARRCQLVTEYSTDPIWSPSGQFLVYSGADVGTNFPVKAVSADGVPHDLPQLILTRGARRMAFLGEECAGRS